MERNITGTTSLTKDQSSPMKLTHKSLIYLIIIFGCFLITNNITNIPVAFPKFILGCLVFLFIPGDCLYSLFLGKRNDIGPWEKLPIIFCLGLGFISVLGLAAYLLHPTWLTLQNLVLCSGLGLLIISLKFSPTTSSPCPNHSSDSLLSWSSKTDRFAIVVFIGAIIAITGISFYLGGTTPFKPQSDYVAETQKLPSAIVGHRASDRVIHWGFIKKLADGKEIHNQWDSLNYSYNIWHLFIALVSKFAGTNYRWIWSYSILYCIPLSILAVFSLGKVLFNNERLALVCALVYLVNTSLFNNYFSDLGFWGWIGAPNPRDVGFILMTMISFFVLKYLLQKEERFFWITILLGSITLFIHDIDFLFVIISLVLFAIAYSLFRWQDKDGLGKLAKLTIVLLIIAVPIIFIKAPPAAAPSNPVAANPAPATSLTISNKEIMGVKADQLGILPTPIIFLSFLMVVVLFPKLRQDRAALFLAATTVFPPLIAYNPIIPALIGKTLAALSIKVPIETIALVSGFRTACLFPAVYICAYGLYKGICFLEGKFRRVTNWLSLALGIIIALLAVNQFTPIKFLAKISWPFYPAWAIVLLAIINLALLASERFFAFPSKLLADKFNNNVSPQKEGTNFLIPTLIFTMTALVVALPVELKFFTAPIRFQSLEKLAEGSEGFKFLNKNIPKDARILSDPVTSFYLPAYTGHSAVGFDAIGWKQQISPISALNPNLSAKMRLVVLKKYEMNYLYLDWRIISEKLQKEAADFPQHYRMVYQDKNTGVYELHY